MPMYISDSFCVHVFAVLVQLSCRGCEARCTPRLAVGRNGEFALLRYLQSYGFARKLRTVRGQVLTLIWYQKLISKLGPFSEPKNHKTIKTRDGELATAHSTAQITNTAGDNRQAHKNDEEHEYRRHVNDL